MNVEMVEIFPLVEIKVVKETLSRIGIADKKNRILYPSCYVYTIDDKHFIVHFKQLFKLTRETAFDNLSEEDIGRRNSVIFCLSQWGLINVNEKEIDPHTQFVFVLPFGQKREWSINHKFDQRYLN